jgi:hypothetical protein
LHQSFQSKNKKGKETKKRKQKRKEFKVLNSHMWYAFQIEEFHSNKGNNMYKKNQ